MGEAPQSIETTPFISETNSTGRNIRLNLLFRNMRMSLTLITTFGLL